MSLFRIWYDLAVETKSVKAPHVMTMATVNSKGHPSARVLALGSFSEGGFKFSTNYRSPKAQDLEATPYAALVFYWVELGRSVRIEGHVQKVSEEESNESFQNFPRAVKIVAAASENQSAPQESLEQVAAVAQALDKKYKGSSNIERPSFWGGYIVIPERMEFYEERDSMLSDRLVFARDANGQGTWLDGENGWVYQKLQP